MEFRNLAQAFKPPRHNAHLEPRPRRSGVKGVYQQHRSGHRANAAGDRRDGIGDLLDSVEIDVTDQALVIEAIDPDVDDRRSRLDMGSRDHPRHPDGRDEDVGFPG